MFLGRVERVCETAGWGRNKSSGEGGGGALMEGGREEKESIEGGGEEQTIVWDRGCRGSGGEGGGKGERRGPIYILEGNDNSTSKQMPRGEVQQDRRAHVWNSPRSLRSSSSEDSWPCAPPPPKRRWCWCWCRCEGAFLRCLCCCCCFLLRPESAAAAAAFSLSSAIVSFFPRPLPPLACRPSARR